MFYVIAPDVLQVYTTCRGSVFVNVQVGRKLHPKANKPLFHDNIYIHSPLFEIC